MNTQAIQEAKKNLFTLGVKRILEQGVRCTEDVDGRCVYRGPEGRRCVVGGLIDDEFYDQQLENQKASDFAVIYAIIQSNGLPFTEDSNEAGEVGILLDQMQDIHDTVDEHYWKEAFEELAIQEGI